MHETTVLHIFEDKARGLALIRGTYGTKDVLEAAHLLDVARYSTSGKGWCLSTERVGDVCAAAEVAGARYFLHPVTPSLGGAS